MTRSNPVPMPEVPDDVAYQAIRAYAVERFPYDYPAGQEEARARHIDYDVRSYMPRPDSDDPEDRDWALYAAMESVWAAAHRQTRRHRLFDVLADIGIFLAWLSAGKAIARHWQAPGVDDLAPIAALVLAIASAVALRWWTRDGWWQR